ncbi:Autophagy-related protein 13 [Halotydeus destructor]|nr:Autophagy-related protein 13 [Halotydeus destructor]
MSQKELDKFTRHFVQKAVQIIVQSRLGGDRIKTDCNKNGNDWFNIAIHDIRDVKEQANKCIDTLGSEPESSATSEESSSKDKFFSLATDWRLCCEISLKTTEGESMV